MRMNVRESVKMSVVKFFDVSNLIFVVELFDGYNGQKYIHVSYLNISNLINMISFR